ncbi:DUF397 domain-containing protein [Streptomyces werraensis]|uniref:DUF397 domain-containing protein n=1 Tax=Streptomyces werraensis TaxID=68284 RepID=UPI00343F10C6
MPASSAGFCTLACAALMSWSDLLLTPFSTAMIWFSLVTGSPFEQREPTAGDGGPSPHFPRTTRGRVTSDLRPRRTGGRVRPARTSSSGISAFMSRTACPANAPRPHWSSGHRRNAVCPVRGRTMRKWRRSRVSRAVRPGWDPLAPGVGDLDADGGAAGSGGEGGETNTAATAGVHIRDSKSAAGPVVTVSRDAWAGFLGPASSERSV